MRTPVSAAVSAILALQAQPLHAQDAASQEEQKPQLEEVVVRGLVFKYDTVETANKMDLSIKDTPQSVKIITADMLDFSGVTEFEDAYKLDAGATTSHSQDQFVTTYFRGFRVDSSSAVKVDGFRMSGYPTLDLAPFERFEIIKGAVSTIYGQAPIAGTLNAVSKKPRKDFGGEFSMEGGNYGHVRGEADVYGGLNSDGSLSGRLIASYTDQDSFLDFAYGKHLVIAPSVRYEFTPQTSITLLLQYQDAEFMPSFGFGVQDLGGDPDDPANYVIPNVPRSRLAANPDSRSERDVLFNRAVIEHHFHNDWMLRANLQQTKVDVANDGTYASTIDPDGFTSAYMYMRDASDEVYSGEVNLFGDIELGGREHTLFFGVDYFEQTEKQIGNFAFAIDPDGPGFDIFDPDYSAFLPLPQSIADYDPAGLFNIARRTEEYGITTQAILHPTERLTFILGARYSHADVSDIFTTSLDPSPPFGPDNTFTAQAWTFNAGTTFALTDDVNIYASYGESFTPRNDFAFDPNDPSGPGISVGPEEGEAYEIGLKGEIGDALLWSAAVFDIARTNISEADLLNPPFVLLRGKQRARGFEADLQGELKPGWDVYLSVALLENEFEEGEFDGFKSMLAPKVGVSLFSSYEFETGSLSGFGFGGGIVYKQRDDFRSFDIAFGQTFGGDLLGDVMEVDARVFYKRDHWNFQLAATNLFDDTYYSPENNSLFLGLSVNPGRQVIGKVTYEF
jgi:TonB-dependent siderophore receptor